MVNRLLRSSAAACVVGSAGLLARGVLIACAGGSVMLAGCASPGDRITVDPTDGTIRWKERAIRPGDYLRRVNINGRCYLTDRDGTLCVPCEGGTVIRCSDAVNTPAQRPPVQTGAEEAEGENILSLLAARLAEEHGCEVNQLTLALGLPETSWKEFRSPVLELLQVDLMSQTVDLVLVTRASYVDLTARFPEGLLVEGYALSDVTDPTSDGLLLRFAGHWRDVLGAAKALGVEESAFSVTNRHGSFIVKTSEAEGAVWYNGLRVY